MLKVVLPVVSPRIGLLDYDYASFVIYLDISGYPSDLVP